MAGEYGFEVLRLGYDEEVVKKFLALHPNDEKEKENNMYVSYHDSISPNHPLFKLIKESHSTGTGRHSSCSAICRLPFQDRMIRPGGSTSGPMMMTISDWSMFCVSYALVGKPLAVTTNLQINFFRKPMAGQELIADARLIKGGKRLHVFEVDILAIDKDVLLAKEDEKSVVVDFDSSYEDDLVTLVAHSTGTYSIPV